MEFVRERSWCEKGKSTASFLPTKYPLMPECATSKCSTSASQPFFRDSSILTCTSTTPGEASGKDLRRQRERRRPAGHRRWVICLSTVCRRRLLSRHLPPNAKQLTTDAGWIG